MNEKDIYIYKCIILNKFKITNKQKKSDYFND